MSGRRSETLNMARGPDELADSIPYLRRYARALTGSQALGDQYVGVALEVAGDSTDRLGSGGDVRRELFRLLHEVWARAVPAPEDEAQSEARAWDLVGRVARRERQLLLLVAVEGCSLAEAAYILGIDEAEAHRLFRLAQATVVRHARVPILIIEDEMLIAMDLEAIVEAVGHKVCGIAVGEGEALALAMETRPRLILADIHLKDGQSGIVAVRKILSSLNVPVIFITGYPQELLTGMSPEPAFVIAKPFKSETVIAAVSQALLSELPAEPDAAWRLRGRSPEEAETRLRPPSAAMIDRPARVAPPDRSSRGAPGTASLRHGSADARFGAGEGLPGSSMPQAATQGNGHARRADTSQP